MREFYANSNEHKDLKEYVMDKWVRFDRTTINRFYELSDIDEDNFSRLCEEGIIDPTYVIR